MEFKILEDRETYVKNKARWKRKFALFPRKISEWPEKTVWIWLECFNEKRIYNDRWKICRKTKTREGIIESLND